MRIPRSFAVLLFLSGAPMLCAAERYAFLVGVREYDKTQLNSLNFTENDVVRLAEVLRGTGYRNEDIVLMTQTLGASKTRFLPVAQKIRRELALLLGQVRKEDSILVALSGHGIQFAGDADLFYCPADADLTNRSTLISLGDVYKDLEKCPAAVKLLFVDACRNEPLSNLGKSRRIVELQTLEKVQPRDPPGGIAAFFSCSRGEQSFEHPDLKQGIFFHFVTRALSGAADFNKDQQVSLPELEQFAVGEVQRYARVELGIAQTPERRGNARGLVTLATLARPVGEPDRLEEPEFKPLFNGRDLTGWDGRPTFWSVKDGTIVGQTTNENSTYGNTYLIWRGGEVDDFELRFSCRLKVGNTGVQYRSRDLGNWVVGGYQADFEVGDTWSGVLYEEKGRGILARRGEKVTISGDGNKQTETVADANALQAKIKKEDWNDYTIIARGNHLTHIINGAVMAEVIDKEEQRRASSGLLALQLHGGAPMKVEFKNIRLKRLK